MFTELLAIAAALFPMGSTVAVDDETTLYASFDDARQPVFAMTEDEFQGDGEYVAKGRFGAALRMRGEAVAELSLGPDTWPTDEGTLEFWLRPEWGVAARPPSTVLDIRTLGNARLNVNLDEQARFGVASRHGRGSKSRWRRISFPIGPDDTTPLQSGRWHHVAVVWGGTEMRLFIDGRQIGEPVAIVAMPARQARLQIGPGLFSIDELRLSKSKRYPNDLPPTVRAARSAADRRHYVPVEPPGTYAFDFALSGDASYEIHAPHYSTLRPSAEPEAWNERVELRAARGEFEPAMVVVYAGTDVELTSVDLEDAEAIPGLELDKRVVVRSPMRRIYNGDPADHDVIPRFLTALESQTIPAGEFREIWLTFRVPENAPSGRHALSLRLNLGEEGIRRLPVTLTVHPFSLPEAELQRMGAYYKASRRLLDVERLRAELADLRAHGVTDLVTDLGLRWRRSRDGLRVSAPGLARFLAEAEAAGFKHTIVVKNRLDELVHLGRFDDDDDRVAVARMGAELLAEIAAVFPGEIAVTHLDEIFNESRLEQYISLARLARAAEYPRLYATFHTIDARADEMRARVSDWVDIRSHHAQSFEGWLTRGHSMTEYADELKKAGAEGWLYYNLMGSYVPPLWSRIVNGLYLHSSPFVLNAPWIYQDYAGNPYDDGDRPSHDYGLAFPEPFGRPGIATTTYFEQMREGQDDLKYLRLLGVLSARDPERHVSNLDWIANLDRFVRTGRLDPPSDDGNPSPDLRMGRTGTLEESPLINSLSQRLDGPELDGIRREAAERIESLLEENPLREE